MSTSDQFTWTTDSTTTAGLTSYTSPTTCGKCGYTSCICYATVVWPDVAKGETNIVIIPEELKVCIVCGDDEAVLVLCDLCKEAVKLARNKWLEDFRREIEDQIGK